MTCAQAKVEHLAGLRSQKFEDANYFPRWKIRWGKGLCSACIEEAKTIHERSRRALWDELPSIWGLPPWDELTKGNDWLL